MSQEDSKQLLNVRLFQENETDILEFNIGSKVHKLDLNSEDHQMEIKKMFCDLIPLLENNSVELVLKVDEGYDNTLLKEVSTSYIGDLNKELENVRTEILDERDDDEEREE